MDNRAEQFLSRLLSLPPAERAAIAAALLQSLEKRVKPDRTAVRRSDPQDPFLNHCFELLSPLGTVRTRRMFAGQGLYIDDIFVAIAVGDTLYLKGDEETRLKFEAAGARQFEYERKGEMQAAAYWSAPPEAMDSPKLMRPWAQIALDAARRAVKRKPSRR